MLDTPQSRRKNSEEPLSVKSMIGSIDPKVFDTLDFTRCVRPDGTAYGTAGTCRKGVQEDLKTELGGKAAAVIDKYASELKKVWPKYSKEELKSAVQELLVTTESEYQKVLAGDVTKGELEEFVSGFQMPALDGKKFLVVGMEPGRATDDAKKDFATDLATFKVGQSKKDLELAMAAQMILRSVDVQDQFAKNVVGTDPQTIRGNTYAKQLAQIRKEDLRPEQLYMSFARGNVRPVAALGINKPGVYEAINSQKDPYLRAFGRKESGEVITKRVSEMLDRLIVRGRDKDFEGGLFAPGGDAEAKRVVKAFVDDYRSRGGRVVEYTTKIGSRKDTAMKTYALQLDNGKPFIIFESSLNNLKLAGKNVREAYNDTLTNFVRETQDD